MPAFAGDGLVPSTVAGAPSSHTFRGGTLRTNVVYDFESSCLLLKRDLNTGVDAAVSISVEGEGAVPSRFAGFGFGQLGHSQ